MTVYFPEMDYAKLQQLNFASLDADHPIAHDVGAGIKTQDNLLFRNFSHAAKLGRRIEF